MGKRKLQKFEENKTFPHLFQPSYEEIISGFPLRASWKSEFFQNSHSLILELGCGKGEYTLGLAEKNPALNFVGIDIKGARLWQGCKLSLEKELQNVAFLRTHIELINHCFGKDEVDEIWLSFPDPQPTDRREKKRLSGPGFLEKYRKILKPKGVIHLKTDNVMLFEFTLEIIEKYHHNILFSTYDLYNSSFNGEATEIQTFYEMAFLEQGLNICYLQFELK